MSVIMVGQDENPGAAAALRFGADLAGGEEHVLPVHVHGRPAARGLRDAAEANDAALIIVGATHRGPIGRMLPGAVTHDLMAGSSCAVAVVPASYAGPPERVVVGYDGRPEADSALRLAEELAGQLGARLLIAGVCEPLLATESWVHPGTVTEHVTARMRRTLDGAAKAIRGDAETRVVYGLMPKALTDLCDPDRDLLVMGSRGHGTLRGVVIGSSARYAADHAVCPLVVAPRQHRSIDFTVPAVPGRGAHARS